MKTCKNLADWRKRLPFRRFKSPERNWAYLPLTCIALKDVCAQSRLQRRFIEHVVGMPRQTLRPDIYHAPKEDEPS
jgi:hypothetical protein